MTQGERIRRVRKIKDLTQQEFGKRIGIKPNSVSLIESNSRNASAQVILSICREFNVDENWLRNGGNDDPVFVQPEKFSLEKFVKTYDLVDDLELQIIKSYFELPKETRQMLVQHFQKGLVASEEERKSMRERVADLYEEQNQTEEKPDAPASSANESAVG